MKGQLPQPSTPFYDLDVPIVLRKCKQSFTDHPISYFIFYDRLNFSFRQFVIFLSTVSIPRSYEDAILVPAWKQTMNEEIDTLVSRETRELVSAPTCAVVVSCRWV